MQKGVADLSAELSLLTQVLVLAPIKAGGTKASPVTAEDKAEAGKILEQMKTLLQSRDTAVNDLVDESKDILLKVGGEAAGLLDKQIQDYDYKEAQKTLEKIKATF